jgi:hypothetical protein
MTCVDNCVSCNVCNNIINFIYWQLMLSQFDNSNKEAIGLSDNNLIFHYSPERHHKTAGFNFVLLVTYSVLNSVQLIYLLP